MKALRCLTLNLWGAEPPLQARMALVVAGLRELGPDVVALQEVREVPGQLPNQAEALAKAAGFAYVFAPATPFGGGQEGLAILSRQPILEHHVLELPFAEPTERRILLSGRVQNGQGSVWVHTTHLNYRLTHGKQREDQVSAIAASVASRTSDAPQILMGDFNARPEADEIRFLRGLVTLGGRRTYFQDAWERLHPGEPGLTWARANPSTAKLAFLEPDRRLDYIFVTPMRGDGRGTVHSCAMVFDKPGADSVFASDHFGLLAEIQVEPLLMFRLAQVSDPHFQSFRNVKLRDLLGKRALGGLNLLLLRRRKHSMALLQALLEDLPSRGVDHLALTGDMCNIALESEWAAALRWIEATKLPADRVTVIPGNHDAYVPKVVSDGVFERMFAAYQTAELRADNAAYPFVRLRGDVALVCTSTGVPTGDTGAWGRVGESQLFQLESLLTMPEVKNRRRVVLIHHPPLVNRHGEERNLRDRSALQALLARAGADLVLHGHDHRDYFNDLPGPGGTRIPVVGAGSASYDGPPDRRSRYHVFEIADNAITVITYAHDPASNKFVEFGRKTL